MMFKRGWQLRFVLICICFLYVSCTLLAFTALAFSPYCGPVSCYVVLDFFGVDCTLKQVSDLCNYDIKPVKLSDVHKTLNSFDDIKCSIEKCTPAKVKKYLSVQNTVLLLVLDSNDQEKPDHLVVLLSKENELIWIDYPSLINNYDLKQLPDNLDTRCLLIRKRASCFSANAKYLLVIIFSIILILSGKTLLKKKKLLTLVTLIILANSVVSYGADFQVSVNDEKEYFEIDLGLIDSNEPNIIRDISIKN